MGRASSPALMTSVGGKGVWCVCYFFLNSQLHGYGSGVERRGRRSLKEQVEQEQWQKEHTNLIHPTLIVQLLCTKANNNDNKTAAAGTTTTTHREIKRRDPGGLVKGQLRD